jgi:hypothetical protein
MGLVRQSDGRGWASFFRAPAGTLVAAMAFNIEVSMFSTRRRLIFLRLKNYGCHGFLVLK